MLLTPIGLCSRRLTQQSIVNGASKGCVGTSFSGKPAPVVPGAEWAAVPGWDPATGLGTPLFDRMKVLALG